MKPEDYKKINELLKSSIRGLDGNTTAYINGMIKEAQKELLEEITKDLKIIKPNTIGDINDYCMSVERLRRKYQKDLETIE